MAKAMKNRLHNGLSCKGDGIRGRCEAPSAVVDIDRGEEAYEGHVRRYFVSSKGVTSARILQASRWIRRGGGFGL